MNNAAIAAIALLIILPAIAVYASLILSSKIDDKHGQE